MISLCLWDYIPHVIYFWKPVYMSFQWYLICCDYSSGRTCTRGVKWGQCQKINVKSHQYLKFGIVLFRRISEQWMRYSFDCICSLLQCDCYGGVCLLACQHLVLGQPWVPHVFLWPWMSDKVITIRIILIIFRMYRMSHSLWSQKRNSTWYNVQFQYNPINFATFHFWPCPQFSHPTHAPQTITNQASIERQINRLSSDN